MKEEDICEERKPGKLTFGAFLATAIVCYLFWLLVTNQISQIFAGTPAADILIAGALVSIGVAIFAARFFVHRCAGHFFKPARLGALIVYCLPVFLWELTKANLAMVKHVFRPKLPENAGIVKVPVNLKQEYALAMLANSITLTPGTITVDMAEQDEQGNFYIHWIDVEEADRVKAGDSIKGTMEKWMRRIWE